MQIFKGPRIWKRLNATPIYGSKLQSTKLMCMLKLDLHLSLFSHCKILGKLTEAELFFLFWCVWGWAVYQFSRAALEVYPKLGGLKQEKFILSQF